MSTTPAHALLRTSGDDVEPAGSGRPVVVDIYARLSRNPNGELEKVDVQLADCRAVAA